MRAALVQQSAAHKRIVSMYAPHARTWLLGASTRIEEAVNMLPPLRREAVSTRA